MVYLDFTLFLSYAKISINLAHEEMNSISSNITEEIKDCLTGSNVYKALLFGSYARGEAKLESDVDLLLILNRYEPFNSYRERKDTILEYHRRLRPISVKYGLDLVVFTQADWKTFLAKESWFSKEIQNEGLEVA